MNYIGKLAEYSVITELLKRDIEAYLAINTNQEDYDITVITQKLDVIRVQVKATNLQNNSTNNEIKNIDKNYKFLIVAVFDNNEFKYFIIPKSKVLELKSNATSLYISEKLAGTNQYRVRDIFSSYLNRWDLISNANI